MPKPQPTARQRIERAFHVSFKLPEQAAELLDAYRDQVLTEAAEIAGQVIGPLWHLDTLHEICDRLSAARTNPDAP